MLKLEYRAIANGVKFHDKTFAKDQLFYEELCEMPAEVFSNYIKKMLGVTPSGSCKCSPVEKAKAPTHGYYTFPADSEYGLNDCKEVVKGGAYTVDAESFKTGVLKLKAVKVEKPVKEK
jgi:hypothetical protein